MRGSLCLGVVNQADAAKPFEYTNDVRAVGRNSIVPLLSEDMVLDSSSSVTQRHQVDVGRETALRNCSRRNVVDRHRSHRVTEQPVEETRYATFRIRR